MSHCHGEQWGDVSVDQGATIAAGVLLQANPESQIVIGFGVCIGAGTVVHAHGGVLQIDPGVTLAAGVLIVGSGKIGENACIGSGATVLNPSIEPNQVIAAGTVMDGIEAIDQSTLPKSLIAEAQPSGVAVQELPVKPLVSGQGAFEHLLTSLFPGRQSLPPT